MSEPSNGAWRARSLSRQLSLWATEHCRSHAHGQKQMTGKQRITSVRFSRYKAFRDFSLTLDRFNILVGPNNSGKSSTLGAFRILAEAIRKARAKSPTIVEGPRGQTRGYDVAIGHIPVATENIFYNYEDDQPASVSFRVSSGDHLTL